jgi:hypothetical protein
MNKKEIINALYVARSSYNDTDQAEMAASLLNTVSTDIYTESQRFVFELIQNADDSAIGASNEVYFDFLSNSLLVSHNGNSFNENDIKSLTTAGSSTKKADSTKTGYKGIGFKSVFGKSKRVTIFSDGYQFRFDKEIHQGILPWQVIPIWTELSDLPKNIQQSLEKNKYNVSTILELDNVSKLENDLKELISNGHILLFLRRVSKISISRNGLQFYSIEKKNLSSSPTYNEIVLLEGDKPISTWITRTFEKIPVSEETKLSLKHDEKTPEKLKTSEFTEVSFAAKVENGKIKSLKNEESLIFTYLPTKVNDFGFPFLVNSSFMTNAARESINSDIVWNQWLFSLVAEKIFDWLSELAYTNYRFQVLNLLPIKFNTTTSNDLKKAFNESYTKNCQNKAFINTELQTIKKPSEVIYDLTGLSLQSFINPKSITEFFEKESGLSYPEDCFVNSKLEEPGRLRSLSVSTFKLEKLEQFFISHFFTSRHSISENFSLIDYFRKMSEQDSVGEWFQTSKTLPFIYDEKGILYNPSFGICFPSVVGQNSTELGNIPIIHNEVFQKIQNNTPVFDWLKKLGMKHPSEIAYVTNVIIPNLKIEGYINEENYLKITFYLFKLFWEQALDEEMLESLRELGLKTKDAEGHFIQAQQCYLSNKYNPSLRLEGIINSVPFISEIYLNNNRSENEWNLFLKALKAKDKIEIETINSNNTLETLNDVTDPVWVETSNQIARNVPGAFGFGSHNVISLVKIPSFLNITVDNFDYSKIFWKNLLEAYSAIFVELTTEARFKYGVGYGRNTHNKAVENYFPWFVKNKKCIPTTLGILYNSTDVYINNKEINDIAGNYFPVFDYHDNITDEWKLLLKFKNKLENRDYFFILETIVLQAEANPGNRPPISRIGLIYNKLASLLPDLSRDWKDYMVKWAKLNKLYSTNGKFERANQLKYITIDGFSAESESFKVIHLPSNCKKDSDNFRELLALLQVQTIDKFEPFFENSRIEFTLKDKLEEILPYFSAVIERRNPDDYTNKFDRLFNLIDGTDFFTVDEITLSFNHMGEQIAGPTLTVFKENSNFYFKGKWSNERILLNLIKELSNHFEIYGFNDELGFLLRENDNMEVLEWIKEMGIPENKLKQKKAFAKQVVPNFLVPITNDSTSIIEYLTSDDQNNSESRSLTSSETPFVPKYTSDWYNMKNIDFERNPITTMTIQEEQTTYSEIGSKQTRGDIGQWTESFVYQFLINIDNFSEIVWENQNGESGKPYDIRLIENGIEKFIDVKGTPSLTKDLIYLSRNEWQFMLKKEQNYSIIRVYGAGGENPKIIEFDNIKERIVTGQIYPESTNLHL